MASSSSSGTAAMSGGDDNHPPLFGTTTGNAADDGMTRSINLDDIFADCFFGPSTDSLPSSTSSSAGVRGNGRGDIPAILQDRERGLDGSGGSGGGGGGGVGGGGGGGRGGDGIDEEDDDDDDDDDDEEGGAAGEGGTKRKRPRPQMRQMTEQQKVERRERNREHAKRSRVRKKFLLESLQQSVNALQQENEKLRSAIKDHLGPQADDLLASCNQKAGSLIASNPSDATRILDDPDYSLVKALQTAQQNFVITDPSLPDNPIVFASQGFLTLTGYTLDQVLGRNCRFLQGPETDPRAVQKIRKAIAEGYDTSVCLLNYRIDGTTFWNQFFVAPLRDSEGNVVNYVGVQCKVSDDFARAIAQSEGVATQPMEG